VADLLLSTTRRVLIPSNDVSLKSSWVLSLSFRFLASWPVIRSRALLAHSSSLDLSAPSPRVRNFAWISLARTVRRATSWLPPMSVARSLRDSHWASPDHRSAPMSIGGIATRV